MISKRQYEQAVQDKETAESIIKAYKEQKNQSQKEREENCHNHEYRYTNSKWRSVTERECINCGKIIE